MGRTMARTLIAATALVGALSLAAPANAGEPALRNAPVTVLGTWVDTQQFFLNKAGCDVAGAAGVARGNWSNWSCSYNKYFAKWKLWAYIT